MENRSEASQYEFLWPIRVYYEDTDAGGVVYYANYLKFMERARTECLRQWGYEQDVLREELNILFAVSNLVISYDKPAVFNEELEIKTSVAKLGKASISFDQSIYRNGNKDRLCAAQIRIACLNATDFTAQAIPDRIIKNIKNIISRS